jgi:parallel beta-helix repeat protein
MPVTDNGIYEDLTLFDNAEGGLSVGANSVVSRVVATSNSDGPGISASFGSTVSDCTSSDNETGVWVFGGMVSGCSALNNSDDGLVATLDGSAITDSLSSKNGHNGIRVEAPGAIVDRNTVTENGRCGIYLNNSPSSIVSNNVVDSNVATATDPGSSHVACQGTVYAGQNYNAGILVEGDFYSRVEGNHVTFTQEGWGIRIKASQGGDNWAVVVRNSAKGNSEGNYLGPADFGPIGPAYSATSPWANIED